MINRCNHRALSLCIVHYALCIGLSLALSATAADFYVAMPADGGDDGNPGTQASPFATIGAAITAADTAISGGDTSATIHVTDGTYAEHSLTLAAPIAIVGESGNRDAVIVDADGASARLRRAFVLNHADARLSGITVRNGYMNGAGGNIYIDAAGGTVANCVVANGRTNPTAGNLGGGNIYLGSEAALVADCVVSNGVIAGNNTAFYGGNIYAANGRVARCTIRGGNSGSQQHPGSGNAYLKGSAVMENCIVTGGKCGGGSYSDKVDGVSLNGNSRLVNCLVIGNSPQRTTMAGVKVNSAGAAVVNCVICGNGGTAASEWGNANVANFHNCAGFIANPDSPTWRVIGIEAFANYYAGDYTPAPGGALVDAGAAPADFGVSNCGADIAGVARPSGPAWDIGCHEFNQDGGLVVAYKFSPLGVPNGTEMTFTPLVYGATGDVLCRWDFDDGGIPVERAAAPVAYVFSMTKHHDVSLSVSTDGGQTWSAPYVAPNRPVSAPPVIWVDENSSSPAYPYGTEATAATGLTEVFAMMANDISGGATAIDGVTVRVKPGTYEEWGMALGSAVTVVGVGDRGTIIVNANGASARPRRTFALDHPGATLSGITIRGGYAKVEDEHKFVCGGNVRIGTNGGVVTNCILSGGMIERVDGSTVGGGGGNVYLGSAAALVVDSEIRDGEIRTNFAEYRGSNIFAENGRVARCLISGGRSGYGNAGSGNATLEGSAVMENCVVTGGVGGPSYGSKTDGVWLKGSSRLVNCTVVGNSPGRTTTAAVRVDSASAAVVNCAIYGNGGTAVAEWYNANAACFTNCGFAATAAYSGTASTVTDLTDADFKDYANADYRPAKGSALINKGTKWADYLAYGALSATDLAGAARLNGRHLDIGCYEALYNAATTITLR